MQANSSLPKIPTVAMVKPPHSRQNSINSMTLSPDTTLQRGDQPNFLFEGTGQTNASLMANSVAQSLADIPVHEQVLRKSNDFRAGHGQDDPIPNLPTMSIQAAQADVLQEQQRLMASGKYEPSAFGEFDR